jgi:HAD superfamily hydrolase (TIGR01549 family)
MKLKVLRWGASSRMSKSRLTEAREQKKTPSFLFDLDGTLLDSAYEHVMAWREALIEEDIYIPNARIHRCVGMSGKLMLRTVSKELGRRLSQPQTERLEASHKRRFERRLKFIRVLPGACELIKYLTRVGVRWAIATGGDQRTVNRMIQALHVPSRTPIITADDVAQAKPDPDVFLEAASRLGVALGDCVVVGDSIWDLLAAGRSKALGVGVLSGGYGEAELIQAGAYRVYDNTADLLEHIAEMGIEPQ